MRDLFDDIERWRRAGKSVAIARVIDIDGSGPREPGAAMAVSSDSEIAGSVSGGCVEAAVIDAALECLESGSRAVHTFGGHSDGLGAGLTCGGTVQIFVEPLDW